MKETTQPRITTIIPTYKRPQLLRRAIRSVLQQTYPHFNVCVYDNASDDETESIVAEMSRADSRISYYRHAENIGAIANFNFGISRVETPFFSVLSDDDMLLPHFYETVLHGFATHPDIAFSVGSVIEITDAGEVIGAPLDSWSRQGYFAPPEGAFEMIGNKHPTITGILFRKERIATEQFMDAWVVIADLCVELQLAARYPFFTSLAPCALFVSHAQSPTARADISYWHITYTRLIHTLERDEGISFATRSSMRAAIESYLEQSIFGMGVRDISRKHYSDVYIAVDILLRYYDKMGKALLLLFMSLACRDIPLFQRTFAGVYHSLKRMKKDNSRFQEKYGAYAKYLDDRL